MVSNGAKQSIAQAVLAVSSPGDEVSKKIVYALTPYISNRETNYLYASLSFIWLGLNGLFNLTKLLNYSNLFIICLQKISDDLSG